MDSVNKTLVCFSARQPGNTADKEEARMGDRAHLNGRLPGGFSSVIPVDSPIRSTDPAADGARPALTEGSYLARVGLETKSSLVK